MGSAVGNAETITDSRLALERCGDLFAADPVGSNMVAASLHADQPVRVLRAHRGDVTLGAAVRWETGWTLTRLRPGAAASLAGAISNMASEPERCSVMGEVGEVVQLAGLWSELTGGAFESDEIFRVYRLAELRRPAARGRLVAVTPERAALAARWSTEFGAAIGHPRLDDPTAQVLNAIEQGRLWMWSVEGRAVAQAWTSAPRAGAVRIGGVYTPTESRGNGYASALTAAVCADQRSRSAVDVVMLNTQAANAMTNRLYRRLGFEATFDTMTVWLGRTGTAEDG